MTQESRPTTPGPFSRFLLAFDMETRRADEAATRELLQGLCAYLRRAIRQRGLWDLPTRYLGVGDQATWQQHQRGPEPSDALEELAQELWLFLEKGSRLRGLHRKLLARQERLGPEANVDGDLGYHVRNFIQERQAENDRLGARVYEILSTDLSKLQEQSKLRLDGTRKRPRSSTRLTFLESGVARSSPSTDLDTLTARWAHELMPELLASRGRGQTQVRARLRELLLELPAHGFSSCTFGELLRPLTTQIRRYMQDLYEDAREAEADDLDLLGFGRTHLTPTGLSARQSVLALIDCIGGHVDRLEPSRWKEQLRAFWVYVRDFAADSSQEKVLPARRLAAELGLPRNAIPTIRATLGRFAEACGSRPRGAGKTPTPSLDDSSSGASHV